MSDSQKQMRLMETEIELAKKNISPIDPPNSGPSKYNSPNLLLKSL